jgi:hypothetical protein
MPAVPVVLAVTGASTAIGAAAATAVGLGTVGTLAATAIGTGIVAGGITAVQGGDISDVLESAVKGGVTTYVGGTIANAVGSTVAEATGSQIAGSAVGNAAEALVTGGDSEDVLRSGLLGGIGAGINEARLAAADEYLSNLPGGYGEYSDLPPDMSDFDVPPAVIDTSFTPDYSLATSAPVIPDMGAQGLTVAPIDTQYQVGSFDYSLGDLIDGLGLQMPNTPNMESMGGGQGIVIKTTDGYITEGGFVPNSYVASLGDPESFINKPVVDVQLSLSELQSTNEEELNRKLAGLDVARALTPYALAALTKRAYDQSREDGAASGFAIVPIPTDWRSPEYNMAFTPSAPIDFGSPEMLAGTQWAAQPTVAMAQQPMDVSTLLNTLNIQQTEQMPQFGMDQVVGNINDVPMSINDIISGLGQNTMQPFDMNRNFGQLNNAPASLNSIIAGIQSQYG